MRLVYHAAAFEGFTRFFAFVAIVFQDYAEVNLPLEAIHAFNLNHHVLAECVGTLSTTPDQRGALRVWMVEIVVEGRDMHHTKG